MIYVLWFFCLFLLWLVKPEYLSLAFPFLYLKKEWLDKGIVNSVFFKKKDLVYHKTLLCLFFKKK